jgi:hypothetical protein
MTNKTTGGVGTNQYKIRGVAKPRNSKLRVGKRDTSHIVSARDRKNQEFFAELYEDAPNDDYLVMEDDFTPSKINAQKRSDLIKGTSTSGSLSTYVKKYKGNWGNSEVFLEMPAKRAILRYEESNKGKSFYVPVKTTNGTKDWLLCTKMKNGQWDVSKTGSSGKDITPIAISLTAILESKKPESALHNIQNYTKEFQEDTDYGAQLEKVHSSWVNNIGYTKDNKKNKYMVIRSVKTSKVNAKTVDSHYAYSIDEEVYNNIKSSDSIGASVDSLKKRSRNTSMKQVFELVKCDQCERFYKNTNIHRCLNVTRQTADGFDKDIQDAIKMRRKGADNE